MSVLLMYIEAILLSFSSSYLGFFFLPKSEQNLAIVNSFPLSTLTGNSSDLGAFYEDSHVKSLAVVSVPSKERPLVFVKSFSIVLSRFILSSMSKSCES